MISTVRGIVLLCTLTLVGCARPSPPPPAPAGLLVNCPSGSEERAGTLSVEYGDPQASGAPVRRYLLLPDTAGAPLQLQLDEQLLEPLGGASAVHGRPVVVGIEPPVAGVTVRHACAIVLR